MTGTAAGVFGGAILSDPLAFGVDAMFPAFFAVLLAGEARSRDTIAAAALGGLIALLLTSRLLASRSSPRPQRAASGCDRPGARPGSRR